MNKKLVNIGDKQLEVLRKGSGANTVIFEFGLSECINDWIHIAEEISEENTVILYNRAGYGRSSINRDEKRGLDEIVKDFEALLKVEGIHEKIILVAHSLGGACAQKLLMKNPDKIKGMVLVDASPLEYREIEILKKKIISIDKKYNTDKQIENLKDMSLKTKKQLIEEGNEGIFSEPDTFHAMWSEFESLRNHNIVIDGESFTCDVPLKVMICDRNISDEKLIRNHIPEEEAKVFHKKIDKLKEKQVKLSSKSERIIANNSGHAIHKDDPKLVIKTIKSLIDECSK
ncbi:alpha/beta hydrolase [Oceanirhabdus sp. W0125-5]|uniref:alpha/beta hydrolase n=1 Tax=Oceanirhabdus sp. W0125-5 TaxID=2999116 RepID=UPI0022F33237|nr:alpha/beta hydrolase [Oceanirhabdus sp. W0125-5]WBW96801.1 alpha/beta hydrolase [Oceanirhabdus sp. W0125-5]